MKYAPIRTIIVLLGALAFASSAYAMGAARVGDAIWANGDLYGTIVTPTSFVAPPSRSTDIIYSFMMSGLSGQRSVAESDPGDADYNGGRWNVQMVAFTPQGILIHDANNDGIVDFELTTAEDVLDHEALGHLVINPANFYFECPLLPSRGNN